MHVPAGAIPKDGPSAGITMVTALASLLTGRTVKSTVGMTGEVTLQGRVLPIGGLKQKVLAAHAAGLTEVILPERNRADLDDVPEEVREQLSFHPVMTIGEVLDLALEEELFESRAFHVHVPAGAIPKDGPSAGITMATAVASLLTERPVKHTVGMTGEITLQGRVLPIGGLKQKVLAAHAAGITDIIIPERNRADLDDIPENVREEIAFHPVMSIGEVLNLALEHAPVQSGVAL